MTKPLTRAELEHKAIRLELKQLDDSGIFEGYASVFGNEDQGADIVAKGAFTASLRTRGATGIKMLYEHDCTMPIGRWLDLIEDDHGLLAKGRINLKLSKGAEVYEMLKDEILDGLSIGYRVVDSATERGNQAVRVLKEVDLREISAVLFPMNEEAVISAVKADVLPDAEIIRRFERWCTQDAASLIGRKINRSEVREHLLPGLKTLLKAMPDAGGEVETAEMPSPPLADATAFLRVLRQATE
jgi:HK97 family phage prohead protease